MADLRLSFAMTPYDKMLPLINGEVKPDGITLENMGMPGAASKCWHHTGVERAINDIMTKIGSQPQAGNKRMKYKAVLFDLDGTLLDTLQDLTDSVNRSLGYLGFPPHTTEAFKYFIGDGRETMAMRSLPDQYRDEVTLKKLVDFINQEYTRHWADQTRPYEGVPELLDWLTANGCKMAILSNKPHSFTATMVSRLLSNWHFEIVAGAMPSIPIKPHPAAAIKIAREMNIAPLEFLYLGDSDIDMKTAVAALMYPVGAVWGFRTADELRAAGAKALIKHPTDLLKLF